MKLIFNLLLVTASLTISTLLFSQTIKPGERMPMQELFDVMNSKSSKLRLSEFKGKNIIIEFWGSNCIACIKSFPELEMLQQKYGEKLQMILVTLQNKEVIEDFFIRRKSIKKPANIPMIVSGRNLFDAVPRDEYYYSVWIDDKGILKYVADSYNINENKVKQFIDGNDPRLVQLAEPGSQTIYTSAFNVSLKEVTEVFSFIGKCTDILRLPKYNFRVKDSLITLSSNCSSILNLYIDAYSEGGKYQINPSNMIIDVPREFKVEEEKDPLTYKEWQTNNSYNYELKVNVSRRNQVYSIMQNDLKRYFGLELVTEMKERECYVLEVLNNSSQPRSKGGAAVNTLFNGAFLNTKEDSVLYYLNSPFKNFSTILKGMIEYNLSIPFIDETNYQQNADIVLDSKSLYPLTVDRLNNNLSTFGLTLSKRLRKVPVYVLREIEKNNQE